MKKGWNHALVAKENKSAEEAFFISQKREFIFSFYHYTLFMCKCVHDDQTNVSIFFKNYYGINK